MYHINRDNYHWLNLRNTQEMGEGLQALRKGKCEDWETRQEFVSLEIS